MEKYYVVQEDTNIFNVFADSEFVNGYLEGHDGEDGYHFSDFDVIFETYDFYKALEVSETAELISPKISNNHDKQSRTD